MGEDRARYIRDVCAECGNPYTDCLIRDFCLACALDEQLVTD